MKTRIIVLLSGLITFSDPLFSQDQLTRAFSKSIELEYKGEYANAIAPLKEVYNEKSYELNLRMGWLSYEAALYVESAAYYQKAMNLMPYSIEAKLGYVYPASALGNWGQVTAQYQKILQIDPQNTVVNYRMGLIEYNNKRYASAYKFFEKVVNLYPFGYDALLMYAWTNLQMGKSREAKVLFGKVLLISPEDASAKEGLGLIK
jgi:tetratricopeptide (TPR) repeat protein